MNDGRSSDEGSAVVEFCVVGTLLLIPVVYLVLALARLQAGALAVEGAAREAGRAFVTADDPGRAGARARQAATLAYTDQGFRDPGTQGVDWRCSSQDCLQPGGQVRVRTRLWVTLPGVPRVVGRLVPLRVELTATSVASVDRFRAAHAAGPAR